MDTYLAITGGVGGAKLALGLSRVLPPAQLAFLANTGDDFEHLGLHVSPDLDTLMYTLAGLNNPQTGWGRVDESWQFITTFAALGGEAWFNLGDRDLAVHVRRTGSARRRPLAECDSRGSCSRTHGIEYRVWPMSDARCRTRVVTDDGELAFQHYFVRDRCAPRVRTISFEGAAAARAMRHEVPASLATMRTRRGDHLSVEPVPEHRPDPRRAGVGAALRGVERR